ncbi:MAG: hypothetical protein WCJ61_17050 [Paludibacter sp.]
MNTFHAIDVSYIRPSRTIETIFLKNSTLERILYVYNFEGWHFRVFDSIGDILSFFDDKFEPTICFENDKELDDYLGSIDL